MPRGPTWRSNIFGLPPHIESEPMPGISLRFAAREDTTPGGSEQGGKARAEKLTPERRREIARRAALARWSRR